MQGLQQLHFASTGRGLNKLISVLSYLNYLDCLIVFTQYKYGTLKWTNVRPYTYVKCWGISLWIWLSVVSLWWLDKTNMLHLSWQ